MTALSSPATASTRMPLHSRHTRKAFILVYVLLLGVYQLHSSFSVEKRLMTARDEHNNDAAALFPPRHNNNVTTTLSTSNRTMSACLLVMDDTIKLTEWLAYHYTVLPLSHLIVAIDPHSVLIKEIEHVLSLWDSHLQHMEVWTNDTWMILDHDKGWPPMAYSRKKKLIKKRVKKFPQLEHVRVTGCLLV